MVIDLQAERMKRETKEVLDKIGVNNEDIIRYGEENYKEKLLEVLQGSKNKLNIIENLYYDFFKNTIEEENTLLFLTFLIKNLQKIIVTIENNREDPVDKDELTDVMDYLSRLRIRIFNTYVRDNYIK